MFRFRIHSRILQNSTLVLAFWVQGASAVDIDRGELARRIALDFPHDRAATLKQLREHVDGGNDAMLDRYTQQGLLPSLVLDGERRWFHRAVRNLPLIDADAARLALKPAIDDGPLYGAHPLHALWLAAGEAAGARHSLVSLDPRRFEVTHRMTVAAGAVPAGETLRIWIPFPREVAGTQDQIELLAASVPARVAPNSDLQRTVYLETVAQENLATHVWIRYRLRTYTRVALLDSAGAEQPRVPDRMRWVADLEPRAPHLVVTPAIAQFAGAPADDDSSLDIARRLFTQVAAKPWAVAREYSTIEHLAEHALMSPSADCGEKAMLLIAALRARGIPARWQSGWQLSPTEFDTMHDWLQVWLPPWGWVPLDPTHGLLTSEDPRVRHFYFGGMDGYRIVFNDDWGRPFSPAKQFARSETVDSQRGEVEWRGGNLYFDLWDYEFDWRELQKDK